MQDSQLSKDGAQKNANTILDRTAGQLMIWHRTGQYGNGRLNDRSEISYTRAEFEMAKLIDRLRPPSMRSFDQIPMHPIDHLRQIKLMAPYLANQSVVFVGDSDGASLLLGLLSTFGGAHPKRMLMLDFDTRLLTMAQDLAKRYQFDDWFEARAYNAFEPIPAELVGQFDWFYANPPYGQYNQGESARLFITRGCELVRVGGQGCIILPHDNQRGWTAEAMLYTQRFLLQHGWVVEAKGINMHRYRLDDDQSLRSGTMLIKHLSNPRAIMPYAARRVELDEIPNFYGRQIKPPYPRYIEHDSGLDLDWS